MPPYLGGKDENFKQGVNFAVGGATALDYAYLFEKGVRPDNNVSLGTQLSWFKEMLSSLCKFPSGSITIIFHFPALLIYKKIS